jgi:hypothetical protein
MPELDERTVEALRARVGSVPRLDDADLRVGEERIGLVLPRSVRDLYRLVGNGGFGPGYGITGFLGGARDDIGRDVVEDYLRRRGPDHDDPAWSWPKNLLAICHWGCGIYSCVDCAAEDTPIVRFDPNVFDGDWSKCFAPERESLEEWLQAWLAGEELFMAGAVPEPAGY